MRRNILVIVNPAAGGRRSAGRRLARIVAALQRRGCTVTLRHDGASTGDAERLAREAEPGFDAIASAGGDGTANAVANGLRGRPVPLAILPLGTANVLAREIGLPRDPDRLAAVIVSGPARPIWPGQIGGRAFLMMASAGFDSEIVAAVRPGLKRRIGRFAFAWAFLGRLCRYGACELTVGADGLAHRAAAMIAAKGRYYAGSFVVAPEAELSEPSFELVLFHRTGRLAVLCYATALFCGLVPRLRDVTILRARKAIITGPPGLPVQADGEIVGRLPVTIGIADQPLMLIRPEPVGSL